MIIFRRLKSKNKFSKILMSVFIISLFFIGYIFFDKLYHPELNNHEIYQNQTILAFQYWYQKRFDEEKAIKHVTSEIIYHTHDQRIVDIYMKMKKDQNISIQKNKRNGNVYIFTNSHKYKSELSIYKDNGKDLVLDKSFWFLHPYKIGYGDYDEENQKIYLGVIQLCLNEGCFLSDHIDGRTSTIDAEFWIKFNKIIKGK